ncbi:helix-turn-helix transcriptional regulator [Mycobacterium sp. MBM]|nr:helix-turn-helix transcriptional regulator [Mycobacterium sp. MBM]
MTFEPRLQDRGSWTIGERCSAAKVLNLLSTKTVFLVVRECFYGTTRFEDFVERIGTSAPAVSRALKQLEAAGVLERTPYREPGARVRDEYRLTRAGEDLLPVFLSLMQWGDAYLQDGKPPLSFLDRDGRRVQVRVTADTDAPAVHSDDLEVRYNR